MIFREGEFPAQVMLIPQVKFGMMVAPENEFAQGEFMVINLLAGYTDHAVIIAGCQGVATGDTNGPGEESRLEVV